MTAGPAGATPPDGPFETFHATGELLSRGRYAGGKFDGTLSRFASSSPGTEPLRNCCVPPGARELRAEYSAGHLLSETFLDERGQPLCADGTPWPERPSGVPPEADYDEGSRRFVLRDGGLFAPTRLRYFDPSGRPQEEFEYAAARATLWRGFDTEGRVLAEWGLEQGKPHGAYLVRFDAANVPYLDTLIREERGTFHHAEGCGSVRLYDEHGALLRTLERGAPLDGGTTAHVTGEAPGEAAPTPGALWQLAERLFFDQRPREAFAAAARAVARDRNVERFRQWLARECAPLRPEVALQRARRAADAHQRTPSQLLGELLGGAEPVVTLRALAASIPASFPAALDYAEAACLLAPEDGVSRAGRGLLRLEHGAREGALDDAQVIAAHSLPAAEFLNESARVLYAEFGFDPLADPVVATGEELADCAAEQPLEAVQRTVGLYATRLALVRDELVRRFPECPAWLPPDTSALLATGRVELTRYVITLSDEDEAGNVEVSDVPVDETLELTSHSVRGLLSLARGDWAALSWLCWSCGLDRIAFPQELVPRELFPDAVNRAALRCFWAHDRLRTEGLAARTRKLPPFQWHGLSIQALPRHLCDIAAAEYLEIRAVFFWLLFPVNVSPFQADLRKV